MSQHAELVLPERLVNQVLTHALQHPHTETCGLISARGQRPAHYYAVDNIAADPATRFEMDPKQQIAAMRHMREHGEALLAIVHSHPHSSPLPSATDIEEAGYQDAFYLIVSLNTPNRPEMRAYRIIDNGMTPIRLRCVQSDQTEQPGRDPT